MSEDLMEQKYVGSAEFNLAEAVYARSRNKNHGWLKKKLDNVKRSDGRTCKVRPRQETSRVNWQALYLCRRVGEYQSSHLSDKV